MKKISRANWPSLSARFSGVLLAAGLTLALSACSGKYANLTADQALDQALHQVSGLRFDNAYELFNVALQKSAPGSDTHLKALFGKATCAQQRMPPSAANITEATALHRQVIQEVPKSLYAAQSTLALGRIAELKDYTGDKVDLPLARTFYQQVIDGWPADPIAAEATLRLSASYVVTYDEEQIRKGIAILEDYLARNPQNHLNSAMWQYLGDTYLNPLTRMIKDDKERLVAYRKCVDAYQKAESIGWLQKGRQGGIYWRVAVIADRYLHDAPLAAKYYAKIIIETPSSGKAYESQLAIRRLNSENPTLNAPVPKINIFRNAEIIGHTNNPSERTHG